MKLKRLLAIIVATGMLTSVGTTLTEQWGLYSVQAATSELIYEDLTYVINSDDNGRYYIEITDCTTEAESVVIPSEIRSMPVKKIGDNAFKNCKILAAIEIPDSVESIGSSAFIECANLAEIEIPASVKSIGEYAFSGCKTLTKVTLQEGLVSIGDEAFAGCSALVSISIPNSVESIGTAPFRRCSRLLSISVGSNNAVYSSLDGNLYNKKRTELIQYLCGKYETEFTIPNTVNVIGNFAFEGCDKLEYLTFPENLTSIGTYAFYGCKSLQYLMLSDGLTDVGESAFEGCSSLNTVFLPDSVTNIGDCAFAFCDSLSKINIPDSVTEIKSHTFSYYYMVPPIFENQKSAVKYIGNWLIRCDSGVDSVNIIEGTKGIADGAFYNNLDLTTVTIPDGLTYIGEWAFCDCESLSNINIPEGVTEIREATFSNCRSLRKINIPNSVTSIGDYAFAYDRNGIIEAELSSITFPNKLTDIGKNAFFNCSKITTVTIPDSVLNIGDRAFFGCKLETVTLGNSVQTIGDGAFCCAKRKNDWDMTPRYVEITIPKSVKSIGERSLGYYDNWKKYSFTINGYIYSEGERYAMENGFQFNAIGRSSLPGDVNADGTFNVSDVVLLQKWLLAVPDTHLVDWKAADLCEDDRLDVFDLCLMKRMLVENS